ncbi:MAG: glycosyltransferase family 1 protein [Geobacter sp.]|nr:glycosyltransferase family 1 protein [Geobacter sp.]
MKIAVLGGHYLKNLRDTEAVWSCPLPLSINPSADNSVQRLLAEQCPFQPDLVLFADQGCLPMLTGIEDLGVPAAAYLIDTHLHYSWHRYFAGMFDLVLAAQQDAALSLQRQHSDCQWLPLFSRQGDLRQGVKKQIDIVFVGTVDPERNPSRVGFLSAFAQQLPLEIRSGDYRQSFNEARIILNQSVGRDINFRVFEAMACGSLLLTDRVGNGLDLLFTDREHLVLYRKGDIEDAVSKARYYLEHPVEREQIAAAGHRLVVARHTLEVRINELLCLLTEMLVAADKKDMTRRRQQKKHAAAKTYLAIALRMADLERLPGSANFAQRGRWYCHLAELLLQQLLVSNACGEELIRDLALLAYLQKDASKAAAYTRIALLDDPDDPELFLLAARVSDSCGEFSRARTFYTRAKDLLTHQQLGDESLLKEVLTDQLNFAAPPNRANRRDYSCGSL